MSNFHVVGFKRDMIEGDMRVGVVEKRKRRVEVAKMDIEAFRSSLSLKMV